MSAPLASSARAASSKDLYLPVPTIKRERNCLPAIMSESVITLLYDPVGGGRSRLADSIPPQRLKPHLILQCLRRGWKPRPLQNTRSQSVATGSSASRFRLRVHLINQRLIPLLNPASPHLQRVRQRAIFSRKFFCYYQHTFQLFEARHVLVHFFDDAFVQRLHLDVRDECLPRSKVNLVRPRPIFQNREVRRDQHRGKFPPVTNHHGCPDERVQLQRILDRLGRDELPARSLDQILLAIRD